MPCFVFVVKVSTWAKSGWFIVFFLVFVLVMLTVSEDWWALQNHVLHIFLGFVFYSCIMGFGPPNAGEIKEHFVGLFGVSFSVSLFCVFPLVKRLCTDLVLLCSI